MDSIIDHPEAVSNPVDWEALMHWYQLEGQHELNEFHTSLPIEDSGFMLDQQTNHYPAEDQPFLEPSVGTAVVSFDTKETIEGHLSAKSSNKNKNLHGDTPGSTGKEDKVDFAKEVQQ